MSHHPAASISPEAEIGENVAIGPFAVIEGGTRLGDGCVIEAGAQVRRGTTLGESCFVGAGAVIGGDPQFRGFDVRIPSGVRAGTSNTFREHVTVHRSILEGGETILGEGNYLMAGAHVGHDCVLGNENTLANNVLLGGHVEFGNQSFVGGGSVFHQFVRVGDLVMVQGLSGFSLDLPPFVLAAEVNTVVGLNAVGLKRAGIDPKDRAALKEAFRQIYRGTRSLAEILAEVAAAEESPEGSTTGPAVRRFYDFLRSPSKKGFCIRGRDGE
jgi:UDP-N-acetylglucosamine acyltransferase